MQRRNKLVIGIVCGLLIVTTSIPICIYVKTTEFENQKQINMQAIFECLNWSDSFNSGTNYQFNITTQINRIDSYYNLNISTLLVCRQREYDPSDTWTKLIGSNYTFQIQFVFLTQIKILFFPSSNLLFYDNPSYINRVFEFEGQPTAIKAQLIIRNNDTTTIKISHSDEYESYFRLNVVGFDYSNLKLPYYKLNTVYVPNITNISSRIELFFPTFTTTIFLTGSLCNPTFGRCISNQTDVCAEQELNITNNIHADIEFKPVVNINDSFPDFFSVGSCYYKETSSTIGLDLVLNENQLIQQQNYSENLTHDFQFFLPRGIQSPTEHWGGIFLEIYENGFLNEFEFHIKNAEMLEKN